MAGYSTAFIPYVINGDERAYRLVHINTALRRLYKRFQELENKNDSNDNRLIWNDGDIRKSVYLL